MICAGVTLFFVVLYWLMTMTGEDISQYEASAPQSSMATLANTYRYLPRVGELYHSIIIKYYEPFARLDLRLIPRFIDVLLAISLLYVLAWYSLLRRPGLDLRSALTFGIIFVSMILTRANAMYLSRFSYLHNYVLGYLITAIFCIPFIKSCLTTTENKPTGTKLGLFVLGILTGYSTEVSPVIILFLLTLVVAVRYKYTKAVQPWMLAGLSGLLVGITAFYATGGLNTRIHGPYASAYEYAFSSPNGDLEFRALIHLLFKHLLFNARYLWPGFCVYAIACVIYFMLCKKAHTGIEKAHWLSRGVLVFSFLFYSLVYIGISSVIRVDDELYGRFMVGIYICIAITVTQLADTAIHIGRMAEKHLGWVVNALTALIVLINVDMFYAFNLHNIKSRVFVEQLQKRPMMAVDEAGLDMDGSPIFNLRQYPILESWANPKAFGIEIQYLGDRDGEPAGGADDSVVSPRASWQH